MGMVVCEVLYDCEELVGVNHRRWWVVSSVKWGIKWIL